TSVTIASSSTTRIRPCATAMLRVGSSMSAAMLHVLVRSRVARGEGLESLPSAPLLVHDEPDGGDSGREREGRGWQLGERAAVDRERANQRAAGIDHVEVAASRVEPCVERPQTRWALECRAAEQGQRAVRADRITRDRCAAGVNREQVAA